MRRMPRLLIALIVLIAAPVALAQAPERIAVRVGDHPGHGRIVFDWPRPPAYTLDQGEDQVVLHFPPGAAIDPAGVRRPPRNVAAVAVEPDGVRITLRPGTRIRHYRIGPKVVVDVLNPAPETGAAPTRPEASRAIAERSAQLPARRPAAQPPGSTRRLPLVVPPVLSAASPAAPAPTPPQEAPSALSQLQPGMETANLPPLASLPRPAALMVRLIAQPGHNRAILLPYGTSTGAAVLRRGGLLLALFDSTEPLDLAALRNDPVFAGLEVQPLPNATLLRLPLAPPAILRARREPAGWVLEAARPAEGRDASAAVGESAMALAAEGGGAARLVVRASQPGRVVPLTDPESGMPLLFGTVREAGQMVPVTRRLPELDLPATLLGAAVLARADQVTMRAGTDRFLIGMGGDGHLALDLATAQPGPAEAMTRSFDLPSLPPAQLLDRLRALNASLASAPPLTRLPVRRTAGETLLALGLPQEAQAMLNLAAGEDPQAATDPRLAALFGAAALLAGRMPEAMVLQAATLPETDELTFWRAILAAALGDSRAAASGLAATLPLLFDYPEALRARLLPPIALALAEAGATAPLKQLLGRAGPIPGLALPRAMLAEAEGDAAAALDGYDQVARGLDRLARARALRRAIELRLATGLIDVAQAARALEETLFAWRGDPEEAAARLRLAELRRNSGDARGALVLLRETEALFPDRAAQLRPAMGAAFLAALEQESPLSAVALFDAYPELLPAGPRGEATMLMLAERLVGLDLANRAAALLGQAAERAAGPARAMLGLRQGALLLADGDAAGALMALQASATTPLPEPMSTDRSILAARAEAKLGRREAAVAALLALGPAGAEPLSQLLVDVQDWLGAATAFAGHLQAVLPAAPAPLDEQHRRLVLRQAAMLVLAGDEAGVAALRRDYSPRIEDGPLTEAFTMLTTGQLRGLADLPRLQRELQLFRSMPSRLEALRAGGPVTR